MQVLPRRSSPDIVPTPAGASRGWARAVIGWLLALHYVVVGPARQPAGSPLHQPIAQWPVSFSRGMR